MNLNLAKETTQQGVLSAANEIAAYTRILAGGWKLADWPAIQTLVRYGLASRYFHIGDQLATTWTNDDGKVYDCPFDVVDIAPVTVRKNGVETIVPGLWLQAHWGLPAVQFDGNEAFYVNESGAPLPAGTYYITMGNAWGSNVAANVSYHFTLTQDLPVGGQLLLGTATSTTSALPDTAPANWRVLVYANGTTTEVTERLELAEGAEGTNLGTLSSSTKYDAGELNNMQRAAYGYNRWSQGAIRQWCNSKKPKNEWWTPQNKYDRPPNELTSKRGMMAGFPDDFLSVLQPVKVTTALNTTTDSAIGTTEDTWDTFFLPSLEQEYCVPQLSGAEGAYWPYWKERLGLDAPQASGAANANAAHIRYAIENHTSAQYVRLRSASRGGAGTTWSVSTTGYVSGYSAANAYRPAPACVIC